MALFEVGWRMDGTTIIEADDADEAQELVRETFPNFDSTMVESVTVDEVEILSVSADG